jgi:predicted transcriptional regulator
MQTLTSKLAKEQIEASGDAARQRLLVLRTLEHLGPSNDRMIATKTRMPCSTVSARRNELVAKGLVKPAGHILCPFTNKKTLCWMALK